MANGNTANVNMANVNMANVSKVLKMCMYIKSMT